MDWITNRFGKIHVWHIFTYIFMSKKCFTFFLGWKILNILHLVLWLVLLYHKTKPHTPTSDLGPDFHLGIPLRLGNRHPNWYSTLESRSNPNNRPGTYSTPTSSTTDPGPTTPNLGFDLDSWPWNLTPDSEPDIWTRLNPDPDTDTRWLIQDSILSSHQSTHFFLITLTITCSNLLYESI